MVCDTKNSKQRFGVIINEGDLAILDTGFHELSSEHGTPNWTGYTHDRFGDSITADCWSIIGFDIECQIVVETQVDNWWRWRCLGGARGHNEGRRFHMQETSESEKAPGGEGGD